MRTLSIFVAATFLLPGAAAMAQTPAAPAPKKQPAPKPAASKPAPKPVAVPPVPPAPATAANDAATQAAQAQLKKDKAELDQMRSTTVNLIRALVQEGVLSKEKAEAMLPESERGALADVVPKPKAAAPAEPTPEATAEAKPVEDESATSTRRKRGQTVRVPYVPETVKSEIKEQVKQEVLAQAKAERWAEPGTLPEWLDRIVWEGDMRLRYQGEYYQSDNVPPLVYNAFSGSNLTNTQQDTDLWRIRVRLGMLAKITETLGAGFRLATGNLNNPVSTNSNLGNNFSAQQLILDRAYLKWDPSERWSVMGGRMPNPWFWPTDLVWDEDLNFDGLAGSFKPKLSPTTTAFLTAGAFPLQQFQSTPTTPNPQDKWLFGVQGGAEWKPDATMRAKGAVALFDYQNVSGQPNTIAQPNANDWTLPAFKQKGNTLFDINFGTGNPAAFALAPKYRILNLGGEFDLGQFDPVFFKFAADYAKNIGFDRAEIRARTGLDVEPKTNAYQARLTIGADVIRKLHDWQFFVGYRYLERDAVLDAFTDSDFYLGGTDTKGYFVGGFYGLDRNVWLRLRYLTGNEITGPALGNGSSARLPLAIDVLQADLNVRF
ncbi:MAG: putative porin [Burkholderiales bacterium]|nr:putative porin [Burkholderiales bacterium]